MPNAYSDCHSDSHSLSDSNAYYIPNGYTYSIPNFDAHYTPNGNAYFNSNGDAHYISNGNVYSNPNGDAHYITDSHGYSVPNSDTHYIPNGYTYSIPNAHSYSLPHPDPHPPRLIESSRGGGQEQAPTVSLSGWESHTTVIRNPDPVLQMHREVAGNLAPMLTDTRGGLARADWINL